MRFQRILLALIIGIMLAFMYASSLIWIASEWMTNPYYSHGVLIFLISLFLVYLKKKEIHTIIQTNNAKNETVTIFNQTIQSDTAGQLVVSIGLVCFFIGFFQSFPFITALSLLIILVGMILYFYGIGLCKLLLFPIGYLFFAIPLPFLLLSQISLLLQQIALASSSMILGLFGFTVTTIGSEIHVEHLQFYIGIPCSGINSLIALISLTTLFIFFLGCCLKKKTLLILLSIPIAIIANSIRVTTIILIAYYANVDLAINFFHDLSSPLLFILSFIFLALIARILQCHIEIKKYG